MNNFSRTRGEQKKVQEFYLDAGLETELRTQGRYYEGIKRQNGKNGKKSKDKLYAQLHKDEREESKFSKISNLHLSAPLIDYTIENNSFDIDGEKQTFSLEKMIRKPSYIKVSNNRVIKGYFGHSTTIFKKAIVEGSYYLEVTILQDTLQQQHTTHPSSVRIGLCDYDYPCTIPLGKNCSIGYRTTDGSLVTNKKAQNFGPNFKIGDVIGMGVSIAPPYKYPDKNQYHEGSKLVFYKNGQEIVKYQKLKQQFYCVSISLYNYACVSIALSNDSIEYLPQSFYPFIDWLSHEIAYKKLKNLRMFND